MPDDKLTIETPEQIPLEFPLAGIGSRFLALAIDTLIYGAAILVIGIVIVVVPFFGIGARGSFSAGMWLTAIFILIAFVIQFGYFAWFESVWNGQTPGKRSQRLRVIRDSGQPISTFDAVARNLLRIVDGLPGFYGIGIVAALLSDKNKRLGDYVAGTVVVHEKLLEEPGQGQMKYAEAGVASGYDVARVSPEEFQLVEAYLLRRPQLVPNVRARLTQQIVERLAAKLEISPEDQRRPEPLLEKLATEYRNRARFR